MRLVIEVLGLPALVVELTKGPSASAAEPEPVPGHDASSTTASHVEQGDDGVHGTFGFAPVVRA